RLRAIREQTSVHLVLHGGSGVPAEMMHNAINIPGGGVSKVNIATDLEQAVLASLGRETHLINAEMNVLPTEALAIAREAVSSVVYDKIRHFVNSYGHASESSLEKG